MKTGNELGKMLKELMEECGLKEISPASMNAIMKLDEDGDFLCTEYRFAYKKEEE